MFTITTNSPEQTSLLGEKIANLIQDNLIICLEGDLGAGKTLFTQSLCKALKVKEIVTSPTFNLMNVYEGKKRIYHFDLYRLEQPEDLEEIGFYEYTDVEDEVVLIEWPDRFFAYMPEDYLHLKIERGDSEQKRIITINIEGQKYSLHSNYRPFRGYAYFGYSLHDQSAKRAFLQRRGIFKTA